VHNGKIKKQSLLYLAVVVVDTEVVSSRVAGVGVVLPVRMICKIITFNFGIFNETKIFVENVNHYNPTQPSVRLNIPKVASDAAQVNPGCSLI
jgi:hypothetical protein